MDTISLLTTLDNNYVPQLRVLLTSLFINNPDDSFSLYLIHSGIPEEALDVIARQCGAWGCNFHPISVDQELFQGAPVNRQYPKEMYYRLLAPHILPNELSRILYLDPDTLVINPLRPLWETDMQGWLFAAAAHTGKTEFANNVNKLRLGTGQDYYNSGVLLMDLDAGRQEIEPELLFDYVRQHGQELLLPDQDMLNALFSEKILPLEDVFWNYDARNYSNYLLRSGRVCGLSWVMKHTAILRFCGRDKPWNPNYRRRFGVLYLHFMQLTERDMGGRFLD